MTLLGTISEEQQTVLREIDIKVDSNLKDLGRLEYQKSIAVDVLRGLELKGQAIVNQIRQQFDIGPEKSFRIENGQVHLSDD